MERDVTSDIQDEHPLHPQYNDERIRVTDELDGSTHAQNSLYMHENSYHSAYHTSPMGRHMPTPLPDKGSVRGTPTLPKQPTHFPAVAPIGDSKEYPLSPPFEEAGPMSSVWHAYLDESSNCDTNMIQDQRGEVNILLVFAGLFSAVVSTFIIYASGSQEPDYQRASAFFLFDLINIQRVLANGTSLDDITTSRIDPNFISGSSSNSVVVLLELLWWISLGLSLGAAFFAIVIDAWYFHYKGLIKWNVRCYIIILQALLHLSLATFAIGLLFYATMQDIPTPILAGILLYFCVWLYFSGNSISTRHPNCPWKMPAISTRLSDSCRSQITAILGLTSSLEVKDLSEVNRPLASEICAAHNSRIENEVDALRWLYDRSLTSATHRLVIRALAGLSPDYTACTEEAFCRRWDEIRDEKERMLMDCMELSRDGSTRWIPMDIPNIDRRIEPLLRLEVLFPALRRKFPSGLFGEHNLDFSRKLSNTLLLTLSSIDDAQIQKLAEQNQLLMDALTDDRIHHPLVWKKILHRYVVNEELFHDWGDAFTIEMCLNLVTSMYLLEDSPSESCGCTLAYASVTYYKPEILKILLALFPTSETHNDAVSPERKLSLAIVHVFVPDSPSTINSHQPHPFHHGATISKYQLLCVALRTIHKDIHDPVDPPSKQWQTHLFQAILSYMMSDFFTGHSMTDSEYPEFKDLFWTCRGYALACMASLIGVGPESCGIEWTAEWAKMPLFLNIIEVIHDEDVADAPHLPAVRVIPGLSQHLDFIRSIVSWLLGQAFLQGIPGAYEAFQEKGSLEYIAEKCSLHLEFIDGLHGYITGLSDAKAGKFPDVQSDEFPDWHIQDLHQAPVIHCICASISYYVPQPRPILSSLISIDPNHPEWTKILETLNSANHEHSVDNYQFDKSMGISSEDQKSLKKKMKNTLRILEKCLEEERHSMNSINQSSTSSSAQTELPATQHRYQWLNLMRNPRNPNADVELQVRNDQEE
ncbi:hypothetical protein F5146DRAFT_1139775 [Armillaria mellea]|nr:hypothetical protein F5146DRAFT_1139775 [Armillaria mellea]